MIAPKKSKLALVGTGSLQAREIKSVSCVSVTGKDEVFIGQVKKDGPFPRSFCLWSVADNLTRGSALNAIDIARRLPGLGGAS